MYRPFWTILLWNLVSVDLKLHTNCGYMTNWFVKKDLWTAAGKLLQKQLKLSSLKSQQNAKICCRCLQQAEQKPLLSASSFLLCYTNSFNGTLLLRNLQKSNMPLLDSESNPMVSVWVIWMRQRLNPLFNHIPQLPSQKSSINLNALVIGLLFFSKTLILISL